LLKLFTSYAFWTDVIPQRAGRHGQLCYIAVLRNLFPQGGD